jgi:ABC-type nitrate/sulfonate/bicarbonate transport system substrate-binding protein
LPPFCLLKLPLSSPALPACSSQAATVRSFLAATAEGQRYAAAHHAEAAALFCKAVAAEHPQGVELDEEMCKDSMALGSKVLPGTAAAWYCC